MTDDQMPPAIDPPHRRRNPMICMEICPHQIPGICTEPAGHDGPHVATGKTRGPVCEWDRNR